MIRPRSNARSATDFERDRVRRNQRRNTMDYQMQFSDAEKLSNYRRRSVSIQIYTQKAKYCLLFGKFHSLKHALSVVTRPEATQSSSD